MRKDTLTLVVLYSNLTWQRVKVPDREIANQWVAREGDHVMDWYIEEENDNERVRV